MGHYQPSNPRPRLPFLTDTDDAHHAPVFFRTTTISGPPVLRSPETKCYLTMIGWAMTMEHFDAESRKEAGRFYRQREWSGVLETTCLQWLTLPRTLSQIQDVLQLPVACHDTCTASEQRDEYHVRGLGVMQKNLPHYRNYPGRYFALFCWHRLQSLTEHLNRVDWRLLDKHTAWPWTMEQLLPHGAETTARSLFMWTTVDLDSNFALRFALALTTWMKYTYLDVKPYTLTSPTFARGFAGLMAKLSNACFHPPADYKTSQDTRNELQNTYLAVMRMAEIYGMILAPASRVHAQRSIGFNPQDLLASCSIAIECLQHLTVIDGDLIMQKQLLVSSNSLGSAGWKARQACLTSGSGEVSSVVRQQIEKSPFHQMCGSEGEESSVQDWLFLVERFTARGASRHCDHSGCSQQRRLDNARMRVCSQCRIMRYCSRLCQKQAWINKVAPHRDVCENLRFVGVTFGIDHRCFKDLTGKTAPPGNLKLPAIQRSLRHIVKSLCSLDIDELNQPWYRSEEQWMKETFRGSASAW